MFLWSLAWACADGDADGMAGSGGSGGAPGSGGSGGTASSAGSGGNGTAGNAGSGTSSGSGGDAGATDTGGSAGGAEDTGVGGSSGAPPIVDGSRCVPMVDLPPDNCDYPESLGGGNEPEACGVTPGAWYSIGDAEPIEWPERADWGSATGGGVSGSADSVADLHVAADPTGAPIVSFFSSSRLEVRRWNGSDWIDMPLEPETQSTTLAGHDLVVSPSGTLFVAERLRDAIRVLRRSDDAWEVLGEWSTGDTSLGDDGIQLVLDSSDQPSVVWSATATSSWPDVYLRQWSAGEWHSLGGSDEGGGISATPGEQSWIPTVALDASGAPAVAWMESSEDDRLSGPVLFKRWNGSAWEGVDGSDEAQGISAGYPVEAGYPVGLAATSNGWMVAWAASYRVLEGNAWGPIQEAPGYLLRFERGNNGDPYLLDWDPYGAIEVSHWTSSAWETVTAAPERAGTLTAGEFTTGLAVGANGDLALGWLEAGKAFLQFFEQGPWQELGESNVVGAGLEGRYPKLLLEDDLPPMVAVDCDVYEFAAGSWVSRGAPETQFPDRHCSASRNSGGDVLVAKWLDAPDSSGDAVELHVFRLRAGTWEQLGAPVASFYVGFDLPSLPIIAFDASDNPVISWHKVDDELVRGLYVFAWNGSGWVALGESLVDSQAARLYSDQMVVNSNDRPVVSFVLQPHEPERHVMEWSGSDWVELPAISAEDELAEAARLTLDNADAPVFTWPSGDGLEVLRYAEGKWERLAPTEKVLRSLPERARYDLSIDEANVLLRRFEACGWRGLSASDRGGGVSNSASSAENASLSFSEGRPCVAWDNFTDGDYRTFIRCHD